METLDGFTVLRLIGHDFGGSFRTDTDPSLGWMHGGMDAGVPLISITFQLDAVVGIPFVVAMIEAPHVGSLLGRSFHPWMANSSSWLFGPLVPQSLHWTL